MLSYYLQRTDVVYFFDTYHGQQPNARPTIRPDAWRQLFALYGPVCDPDNADLTPTHLKVVWVPHWQQPNGFDCGPSCIALATLIKTRGLQAIPSTCVDVRTLRQGVHSLLSNKDPANAFNNVFYFPTRATQCREELAKFRPNLYGSSAVVLKGQRTPKAASADVPQPDPSYHTACVTNFSDPVNIDLNLIY